MTDNIIDLIKKRDSLTWARIILTLNFLENSIYIFQVNFQHLRKFVDQIPDTYWKLDYDKQQKVSTKLNAEISRLLFNYLSSLKMYIDHSIKVRSNLSEITDVNSHFDKIRIKKMNDDKHLLVIKLVNYIKHDQVVNFWHYRTIEPKTWEKTYTFSLWIDEINKSPSFPAKVKKYVNDHYNKRIDLLELLFDHYKVMAELINDQTEVVKDVFKKELKEVDTIERKIDKFRAIYKENILDKQ